MCIYYFSRAGPAASQRICYDNMHRAPPLDNELQRYCDTLIGVSRLPKESVLLAKLWDKTLGPLVLIEEYERGGHFVA